MLYIISFQSISCSEASPTSPRPHAAPPEGSSARAEVAGLPIGHSLNLPPGFPHVAQHCPLAGLPLNLPPGFPHVTQHCPLAGPSKQFSSRPEGRFSIGPSGRPRKAVWAVPGKALRAGHNPVFSDGVSPDLPCSPSACPSPRPPCPQIPQCHSSVAKPSSIIPSPRPPRPQVPQGHFRVAKPSSIIPSPRPPCLQVLQCHPHVPNNPTISLKPASNRTSTGPRLGHPAHSHLSAIPTCRDVPKPISERCSERFLRRSSDRLPVRARLFGGRGEKEVGKCLEFRNLRLLQGALDGEGTVQNIDRFH